MGLKCSFLGHAYEEAGVEREREEQGSEVVTVVKELEQCTRCGSERVVSESTEVTAVVDPKDVDADVDRDAGGVGGGYGGAAGRAVEESGGEYADSAETIDDPAGGGAADATAARAAEERASGRADEAAAAVDELAEEPDEAFEARDPEEEDAEILTDDDDERDPGEWPDDPVDEADDGGLEDVSDAGEETPPVDPDLGDSGPDEESLSGITVPEGRIVCPDCGFEVDAESSYRDGDPCPECGAWLTTVEE
jgi:DNA-directed RNA polymerase subunit RPC12/RpoP